MRTILAACLLLAVFTPGGWGEMLTPRPCCAPDTWLGTIQQKVRYERRDAPAYGYREAFTEQAYDTANKRVAYRIMGQRPDFYERYVVDHDKDVIYTMTRERCIREQVREKQAFSAACIPDNAVFMGQYFMGLQDIKFNRWLVTDEDMDGTISVTSNSCIPAFSQLKFTSKDYFVHLESVYFNVSGVISDETIFDIPDNCEDAPPGYDQSDLSFFGVQVYYGTSPISPDEANRGKNLRVPRIFNNRNNGYKHYNNVL